MAIIFQLIQSPYLLHFRLIAIFFCVERQLCLPKFHILQILGGGAHILSIVLILGIFGTYLWQLPRLLSFWCLLNLGLEHLGLFGKTSDQLLWRTIPRI